MATSNPALETTKVKDAEDQVKEAAKENRTEALRATVDLLQIVANTELRDQYAQEAIQRDNTRQLFAADWRMAQVFYDSGIFDDLKDLTPQQGVSLAMTKIKLGRSWGLEPSDAMRYLFFTNGKPSVESAVIADKLQKAGWDWDIEWMESNGRCVGCRLWLKRKNAAGIFEPLMELKNPTKQVSVKFDKTDADNAKIWEKSKQISLSEKWNYLSWPGDMYFSRCITRVKRYHAPSVMTGAMTREEAQELPGGENGGERGNDLIEPRRASANVTQTVTESTGIVSESPSIDTVTGTESPKANPQPNGVPKPAPAPEPKVETISPMQREQITKANRESRKNINQLATYLDQKYGTNIMSDIPAEHFVEIIRWAKTPSEPEPARQGNGEAKVSDMQTKLLENASHQSGWTPAAWVAYLQRTFNVSMTAEVPAAGYAKALQAAQSGTS